MFHLLLCFAPLTGGLINGMAVTGAGNLPCRHVFHLHAKSDVKKWKDVIKQCFAKAEDMQLSSLAMPPVGTGK